jgi:hypothetical protein
MRRFVNFVNYPLVVRRANSLVLSASTFSGHFCRLGALRLIISIHAFAFHFVVRSRRLSTRDTEISFSEFWRFYRASIDDRKWNERPTTELSDGTLA